MAIAVLRAERLDGARCGVDAVAAGVRVDRVVVQELPLRVEHHELAAGAEAGVQREHHFLAERRGEDQLAQVLGEDADGLGVGHLLEFEALFGLQGHRQQALPAVADGDGDLAGCGTATVHEPPLQQVQRRFLVDLDADGEELLGLAATHGQHAMADGAAHGLLELEPVAEFLCVLFLALAHLAADQAALTEQRAQLLAGVLVLADLLGDDVAGAGQRRLGVRHVLLRIDETRGFGLGVGGLVLGRQEQRERFQTALAGHGGAGAALGAEREVDVFQLGHGAGADNLGLQLIGQELALVERLQDGLAALVEGGEVGQAITDGGDLDLVEAAGHLLAVARDERHRGALGEQGGDRRGLPGLDAEFVGDLVSIDLGHGVPRCAAGGVRPGRVEMMG